MWIDGYGGIGVVIPNLRAMSITLCSPSSMPSRIVGEVAREVERLAQRDVAHELEIVVLRRPLLPVDLRHCERRVVEHVTRGAPVVDRVGVDDRLERRSGLAERLRRAIELGVVVSRGRRSARGSRRCADPSRSTAPCRYGEFGTAAPLVVAVRVARLVLLHRRVLERAVLAALDRLDLALEIPLGRLLHVDVERRVDLETVGVDLVAELLLELAPHELDEVRRELARFRLARELQRVRLRESRVGIADDALHCASAR